MAAVRHWRFCAASASGNRFRKNVKARRPGSAVPLFCALLALEFRPSALSIRSCSGPYRRHQSEAFYAALDRNATDRELYREQLSGARDISDRCVSRAHDRCAFNVGAGENLERSVVVILARVSLVISLGCL